MKNDNLGDRMKRYEAVYKTRAIRRVPLLVRVDGKAFHTLTRSAIKPFDIRIMSSMMMAATKTAEQMQGFKLAYVQSDEVTFLLTDYDKIDTDAWFGNQIQKIASITASYMSVFFGKALDQTSYDYNTIPVFDARVFQVPEEEIANAFLWRAKDWKRNSLSMYCQTFFSSREMHGKNQAAQHDMLKSIGKSWANDLTPQEKHGLFLYNEDGTIMQDPTIIPEYGPISGLVDFVL